MRWFCYLGGIGVDWGVGLVLLLYGGEWCARWVGGGGEGIGGTYVGLGGRRLNIQYQLSCFELGRGGWGAESLKE